MAVQVIYFKRVKGDVKGDVRARSINLTATAAIARGTFDWSYYPILLQSSKCHDHVGFGGEIIYESF